MTERVKHQYLVECETEKFFQTPADKPRLRDMIANRVWEMDGIVHGTADVKIVGADVVIISRAEYEQMKAKIQHLESTQ